MSKKAVSNIKKEIFLGLTQVHRDIVNKKTINFQKIFYGVGYHSKNGVQKIVDYLIEFKLIKKIQKGKYIWNTEKTVPNMVMVDYIVDKYKAKKPEKAERAVITTPVVVDKTKVSEKAVDVKVNGKHICITINITIE